MGLPGSGKTTLAAAITASLFFITHVTWLNADTIRERYNDWDFSDEGRLRQARRMRDLADQCISEGRIAVCDFIAPTTEIREIFDADYTIWLDTIKEGRYEDTNRVFVPPEKYDYRITDHIDPEEQATILIKKILGIEE
jgi:adenylylsulfate kinase